MALEEFEGFTRDIHRKIGLDLSKYKEKQLKRRILQFMARHNTQSFHEFSKILDVDPAVLERFKDFITINTSEFFRDVKLYEHLDRDVMANLRGKSTMVKIWSAGCSIGAEPYSLAILAQEAKIGSYSILASDYDGTVLRKAKEGIYAANLLKNVPRNLKHKYFHVQGDKFCINADLQRRVTFKEHNLLKDSFPRDLDLILCRNVFIYFTLEVQHDLITGFTRSLKPGGHFVIGSSEFIPTPETFGLKKAFFSIYQKAC